MTQKSTRIHSVQALEGKVTNTEDKVSNMRDFSRN